MSEAEILAQIRLAVGALPLVRIWRNNTGKLRDRHGRMIEFGLCPGSSDLIGATTITITPEMVGRKIAIFTAIEVKSDTGKPSREQQTFIDVLRDRGARAGVARSVDDAMGIIRGQ